MAQFGQYRIDLLDWYGNKDSTLFPGNDFLGITWEHKRNQPGTYRVDLSGATATKDRFEKHYQVRIERNWGANPKDWYTEFTGFHLGLEESWPTSAVDEHYWSSVGLSPEWLVSQALLQPQTNPGGGRYEMWWNHGPADDTIKLMVAESMTSPADATRLLTLLSVQGNAGEANWDCYEGSWVRLADAIQSAIGEDGTKGGCDYRVMPVTGGYEFRTYTPFFGTDRRRGNSAGNKPVVFSYENGNIKNADRSVLWAEAVTAAYGGWTGKGSDQTIVERTNPTGLAATPYARREAYYDLSNTSQEDQLPGILDQKLIDDGEREFITATVIQTDACLYGRDFWFGDLVTLDLPDGHSYDMRLVEVSARLSGDKEEEIEGTIELWTREETA